MTTEKGARRSPVSKYQGGTKRGRDCPPHGPIMVGGAFEEGYYVALCLACGQTGPEREDSWEAKLAFDKALQPPPG
jgi:hypothetical protein